MAPFKMATPVLEGAQLRLGWSGTDAAFQLEDAPTPGGPWRTVGNPLPETTARVDANGARRFFRVIGTVSTNSRSKEEAMKASLSAVASFVNTVPRADRKAWQTQILSFLNQRADIDSAGDSPDGVWAITIDGIPLAIWNNRTMDPPGEEETAGPVRLAGTETPGGGAARFASTIGSGFRLSGPRLSRLVAANGYSTVADTAPLHSLKGIQNQSIFFFNTHAGALVVPLYGAESNPRHGTNGKISYESSYALWSGTKIDPRNTDPEYNHDEFVSEFKAKRLALALAPASYQVDGSGNQVAINEWRFAITAQWIRNYMKFPSENHASVWLAACLSATPVAAPMRAAFRSVGADMVSTWTSNVDGDAVLNATSFLFDRLLGANKVVPPAIPQRPFDYENSWTELRDRGLQRYPTVDENNASTSTEIVYEGAVGEKTLGAFAPSIACVLIDEITTQAHLIGLFGRPPSGGRQVSIGGMPASIVSWEPRKIVCTLPPSGDGSAGDVQVIVLGHRSNVRRISRWTMTGTYSMTDGTAQHAMEGTLNMIFRADVGEYREVPGNVFVRPTRYAWAAQHSEVYLEAKGIFSEPCGEEKMKLSTWLGSGRLPTYNSAEPNSVRAILAIDTRDQAGAIGMELVLTHPDSSPWKISYTDCDGLIAAVPLAPGPIGPIDIIEPLMFGSALDERLPDGSPIVFPLPGGSFTYGQNWAIPPGSVQSQIKSGISWNLSAAEFAPDPLAAR